MSYAELCFFGLHLESFGRYDPSAKTPACAQSSLPTTPHPLPAFCLLLFLFFYPPPSLFFSLLLSFLCPLTTSIPRFRSPLPCRSHSGKEASPFPFLLQNCSCNTVWKETAEVPKQFNIAHKNAPREILFIPRAAVQYIFIVTTLLSKMSNVIVVKIKMHHCQKSGKKMTL